MNTTAFEDLTGTYLGYVVQGSFLIFFNGVIVAAFFDHKHLRSKKELALPALLAFCDAIDGLAAFSAGLGRIWLIKNGEADQIGSRVRCLLTPWIPLWVITHHISVPVLVAISIDRMIAVGWPLFHYGVSRWYAIVLAISPVCIGYPYVFYYTLSRTDQNEVQAVCYGSSVYGETYYNIMRTLTVIGGALSVVLYIPVIFLYLGHKNSMLNTNAVEKKNYVKTQRKMTVTLGISCIFTAIFFVIPALVRTFVGQMNSPLSASIISYAFMLQNINKMANVFLYSLRHRNLRLGIKFLFHRKQLTPQIIQNNGNAVVPMNVINVANNQFSQYPPGGRTMAVHSHNNQMITNRQRTTAIIGLQRPTLPRPGLVKVSTL